jgi:pilus assembly protein CpaF
MALMAGMELPVRAIREQIASAIDVVIHEERMRDGTRKITNITEVSGMEGEVITMTDVFVYEQSGYEEGKVVGRLRPTGLRPKFIDKIETAGIHLPATIFGIGDRRRY